MCRLVSELVPADNIISGRLIPAFKDSSLCRFCCILLTSFFQLVRQSILKIGNQSILKIGLHVTVCIVQYSTVLTIQTVGMHGRQLSVQHVVNA